jgi:GTPase
MKFIDEVNIKVQAGNGGAGCLSFRREKYIPQGGPDGGDGGDGGSVFFEASDRVNTLIDFYFQRLHKAQNGRPGMGKNRRGLSAEDVVIKVPVGTLVFDQDTGELIADLVQSSQQVCVAKGGFHGLGNARYKSSVNRAPRQTSPGTPGESRNLRLELKLMADVGLLGFPNAGKSSLIRAISNAQPKVADYPFTTLVPKLGVVRVGEFKSFVVADIPGLVKGAHEGVGLGLRFLRHLSRSRLLLHMVDLCADAEEIKEAVVNLNAELAAYSEELSQKPQWLVFNKQDLLDSKEVEERVQSVVAALSWVGPVYSMSALQRQGTKKLCYDIMSTVEAEKFK